MTKRRHRRRRRFFIVLLLLLLAFLLYDSNTRIEVTEYPLRFENLPDAFDGFRIVQLSDVHAAQFGEDNETLIAAVNDADPDIIAITGDLIDTSRQGEIIRTLVGGLSKIAPVYYITGNNEFPSGGFDELLEILDEYDVTVLRNTYTVLTAGDASVLLAGIDDPNGPADMIKPSEFIRTVRDDEGDAFLILLAHRNDKLSLYAALGVDLVLSGHAHGGLIRLPFTDGLIGPSLEWFPDYTSGVYTEGATTMVVSRGVGNHTGILRFLNNPHIPVVILESA